MFSEQRVIGYWKEETYSFENQKNILVSLIELKNKKVEYPKEKILDYLKQGYFLLGFRGYSKDIFEPSNLIESGGTLYGDGEWVWTHDVIYYVQNYNIGLPDDFLSHVEMLHYIIPKLTKQAIYEFKQPLLNIIRI